MEYVITCLFNVCTMQHIAPSGFSSDLQFVIKVCIFCVFYGIRYSRNSSLTPECQFLRGFPPSSQLHDQEYKLVFSISFDTHHHKQQYFNACFLVDLGFNNSYVCILVLFSINYSQT